VIQLLRSNPIHKTVSTYRESDICLVWHSQTYNLHQCRDCLHDKLTLLGKIYWIYYQ